MFPFSLDYPFFIALSVFSNIYLIYFIPNDYYLIIYTSYAKVSVRIPKPSHDREQLYVFVNKARLKYLNQLFPCLCKTGNSINYK
jgi:hypothetical protein